MLFVFMGESCTGKSTIADIISHKINAEVYSGKEYMKLAKNEYDAWKIFYNKLVDASVDVYNCDNNIIYVITEKDMIAKLDNLNCVKVKFIADIDIIKTRFSKRMKGNLPKPIISMIERKSLEWKEVEGDIVLDTFKNNIEENINKILEVTYKKNA
ncbi:hypothetical protein [Vallitalea maricola]|uniref:Uncharacterized protein n=1 Tax=Vallitalea maricola TaxID=3074433 RepID=A0ACB5UEC0_9FIRM|nr:hypothetical protein AN2V17_05150 [Vallitalea sp. AN17-2]